MEKRIQNLVAKTPTPISSGYQPEVDVTGDLDTEDASYYHSLIGILQFIVELGRIDITCEVSMMNSHLALPREGHLKEIFNVFAYLKKHMNLELLFDTAVPDIDMYSFQKQDWTYSVFSTPGV